ncbi:hypothetical protein [Haloarchaeobius iranensis]|uniref:Uncharacterized protein n=1 Tax=Haloarchaeobius iranensis TaxID=996166 RepID=A0A1G9TT65_9EURY|nr:hypothetical protein [Haloarchaeobius iranensis]SDM50923.1 hypothetical protein SAMN05192554_103118 [Haloarchaeobius iranensis]
MSRDASRYVAICRGLGLSEREIRLGEDTEGPVETLFELSSHEARHARLLATLAGSDRGVDCPGDADGAVVAAALRAVLRDLGRSDAAAAIEDAEGSLFERLAAVERAVLDGSYRVVRLADDDRWRFVVVEARRLAGVTEQFGQYVELEGRPTVHADQPANRTLDPADHLPPIYRDSGTELSPPGGGPKRVVADRSVDEVLDAIERAAADAEEPSPLDGATARRALDAPPSEPAGPPLDEPPVAAPGEVDEEPIVARGDVAEDPIVAPGHVEVAVDASPTNALDAPADRPALDAPPGEPAGPALDEPPIVARGEVDEEPIVARGEVDEEPIAAPGEVADGPDDGPDS